MSRRIARKLVLLMLLPISAGEIALAQERGERKAKPTSSANDRFPFYEKKTPRQLLSDLVTLQQLNSGLKGNLTLPSVQDWVTSKDATLLLDLIGDKTPCLRANNFLSSQRADGPSTVGVEARRMISGFLHGAYPPVSTIPIKVGRMKEMLEQKIAKENQVKKKAAKN